MHVTVLFTVLAVFTAELSFTEALPTRRKSDKTKAGLLDDSPKRTAAGAPAHGIASNATVDPTNYVRIFF